MVRCADCGFLAVRRQGARDLTEVEREMRAQWNIPIDNTTHRAVYETFPICHEMAADLKDEAKSPNGEAIIKVIVAERECSKFTPWHQGHSPKEHKEMLNSLQMQEFQAEQREKDRAWQAEQKRADFEFKRKETLHNRAFQIFIVVFAAIIAYIAGRLK